MTKHHLYGTKMSRRDKWTSQEESILAEGYLSKYSHSKIARILNRSEKGVNNRISHLKRLGIISPLIRHKKGKR